MLLRIAGALAALALIAASFFLTRALRDAETEIAGERAIEQPGYSARDVEIVETGLDGRPRYRLHAARIEQQPRVSSIFMHDIALTYRTESGRDWLLTAERGRMPQDARLIQLEGSVVAAGLPPGSQQTARISTEELAFDTQAERLATGAPVAIDWSGHRLTALGLIANLKEQRLSLESRVHGRFTP